MSEVACRCGKCDKEFSATPQYRHRVLCGDATNAETVTRLMAGRKASLCLTDPPYGIGEQYGQFDDTPSNLADLIARFMPLAKMHSERVLLTPGNKNQHLYPQPDWTLCWFVAAGTGMNPWGFTCWQPVLAYGKCPYLAARMGSRPDGHALTESADNTLGHSCSKPVKVWTWFLERGSTSNSDLILDLFGGSGTTMIACEKTGRHSRHMEIDPKYCDIIVKRFQAFTGHQAVLESTGATFDAVAAERT